jgi:hypothetical protein
MLLPVAFALVLAACSQEDAPSENVAEHAQNAVNPDAAPTPFAKGRFAPRDDCGELEGAPDFRNRLAEAVRLRDANAVVALAADDIQLDFGGGAGAAEFKKRLTDPEGDLWEQLDTLLTLGCAANDEGGLTIPWIFDQDIGDADPYSSMLVMGVDEPVHATANPSSEETGKVSWDLVEVVDYQPDSPLNEVKLADGTTGFIATDKLRAVIDYRLLASRRNGQWSITSFIAGD